MLGYDRGFLVAQGSRDRSCAVGPVYSFVCMCACTLYIFYILLLVVLLVHIPTIAGVTSEAKSVLTLSHVW